MEKTRAQIQHAYEKARQDAFIKTMKAMEKGYLKLKTAIQSSKFGVVFPAKKQLYYFVDAEGRILVLHPTMDNVYIRAAKTNIAERKPWHSGHGKPLTTEQRKHFAEVCANATAETNAGK
jgi:hypothetical protein